MKRIGWLVALLCFAGLCSGPVFAQVTGTIRGTVVDPSGAAVPQANITVTNADTGYARSIQADANGAFEILDLPIGNYNLKVEKQGFKTFSQAAIPLAVNQIYVVKAALQVGETSTTIEVNANALQVDTTSIQRGEVIENNEFKDLPLLNRNWTTLMATEPGVMASSDRFGLNSSNGNRTQANDYLVNGGDANDFALNTPLDIPNPDAIQEVRLLTNTVNPEYSRSSGATLNAISKSGTNTFHGDAWEFYRDTFLNSRNFFSGRTVPPFHQNQFGGDLGGPIFKNKLFAFFSYQGTRSFSGSAANTAVLTNAERGGDWAADLAAIQAAGGHTAFSSTNVIPFPLFGNAESPCPVSGGTPCAKGSITYANLFDSVPTAADANTIPTADFTLNPDSQLANKLFTQFVPAPTIDGVTVGRFLFNNNTPSRTNQYIGRMDYSITSKDSLYGYVFTQLNNSSATLPFIGATLPGFASISVSDQYQYIVNETHIINSNMINELRAQYQRFNFNTVQPQQVIQPSSVGFNINSQITAGASYPTLQVTGLFRLGFSEDGPQPRIDDNVQLADNFSYDRNNHSYKMGIDLRRNHSASPFGFLNNGFFDFFGGLGTASSGVSGADFMLGIPSGGFEQTSGGFEDSRNWEYYSYIQDQWKIKPSLTMTYGAGWDVQTPLADHTNGCRSIDAFRPGQQSTIFPSAPSGLLFPGDAGITCSGTRTRYNNFAPRLGFAWAPTQKWSLRAAWGIYYNSVEGENTLQFLTDPPFSLTSLGIDNGNFAPGLVNPFANIDGSGTPITNPYPFTPPKPGQPFNFTQFGPFTTTVIDPNYQLPYNMNDQLTFEYRVSPTMVASLGYVGSEGRRLENVLELNPLNPAACIALGTSACENLIGTVGENFIPNIGTTADASALGSIGQLSTFTSSNFNSLQATLQKAFSHGVQFRAAYTYGHALDNSSSLENSEGTIPPSNYRLVYGDSAYDARHRFVITYDYAVPDLHSRFGWAPDRIFGGWKISGVTTFQTGFPITLGEADGMSLQCNPAVTDFGCWDRPNIAGPLVTENPRSAADADGAKHEWFTPSSFATETLGVLGNAGRNYFHGPGINNWDISLIKDTRIMEHKQIELRMDVFNAFNHAQFSNPDGSISDGVGAFGAITSTSEAGRIVQLAAKFDF